MNRHARSRLLAGALLILGVAAWAEARTSRTTEQASPSSLDNQEDLEGHWQDARRFLRQGAYEDARRSLKAILTATPDDPWAQAYHTLCERRLQSSQPFTQLTPEQLREVQQRLQREEQAQRRAAARQKAMERTVRTEQERWDRQLEAQEQQAKRQEQLTQREVKAAETARAKREAEPAALAKAEPEAEEPSPPTVSSLEGAVELAPVTVPAAATEPEEVVSPSLIGRTMPPGGSVQINARQMSVSPDRSLAFADGDVEVVFENTVLTCDHLTLFTDTKDVYAEGRVRIEEGTQLFRGELAHYNLETKKGRFLQGTVSSPPWHEHGRTIEHLAEGVYEVTPGYLTSCELEPPHFKFSGRRAIVFADDKLARMRNVALVVDRVPFFYLPWLLVADRQSPFFIIPGKKKPWEQFALMGYRYELPGPANQKGTMKLDWRRAFGWGTGLDHQFNDPRLGKGLLRLYYNEQPNGREPLEALPKGAEGDRYRVLWRHLWQPLQNTTVVTNIQEFSDANFRKDFLFRDEFVEDDVPESFISMVRGDEAFTLTGVVRKRMNRFQTETEAFPQLTFDVREQRIADSQLFSKSTFDIANLQTKNAHSENDTDVVRADWFQQLSYALGLFRPIEVTPRAGIRQTYYTKDSQGGSERLQGERDVISGQFSAGADASLKLFRIFPVVTNVLGLNVNVLRHVLTPTVSYSYTHQPTIPSSLLNFATAIGTSNQLSFGIENKLQTKQPDGAGKLKAFDLARFLVSLPYTFHGNGNKQGGRIGDWSFDLELYPWPWLRLESDWVIPSHFIKGTRDDRIQRWNLDLVMVGGRGKPQAQSAPDIRTPQARAFEPGPRGGIELLVPQGQWYLGLGHRYAQNDKTEDVLQFDWRVSEKWEIGTFHRFTWKEVASGSKRFTNVREYQYALRRDLHDWIAEMVYRVDREFGEELFLTLTLKAYPQLPIEFGTSYHQPKLGSQSSPFSPVGGG